MPSTCEARRNDVNARCAKFADLIAICCSVATLTVMQKNKSARLPPSTVGSAGADSDNDDYDQLATIGAGSDDDAAFGDGARVIQSTDGIYPANDKPRYALICAPLSRPTTCFLTAANTSAM
jgi:hypothetical protein